MFETFLPSLHIATPRCVEATMLLCAIVGTIPATQRC